MGRSRMFSEVAPGPSGPAGHGPGFLGSEGSLLPAGTRAGKAGYLMMPASR